MQGLGEPSIAFSSVLSLLFPETSFSKSLRVLTVSYHVLCMRTVKKLVMFSLLGTKCSVQILYFHLGFTVVSARETCNYYGFQVTARKDWSFIAWQAVGSMLDREFKGADSGRVVYCGSERLGDRGEGGKGSE